MTLLFNTISGVSVGIEFFNEFGDKGVMIDLFILRFIFLKEGS